MYVTSSFYRLQLMLHELLLTSLATHVLKVEWNLKSQQTFTCEANRQRRMVFQSVCTEFYSPWQCVRGPSGPDSRRYWYCCPSQPLGGCLVAHGSGFDVCFTSDERCCTPFVFIGHFDALFCEALAHVSCPFSFGFCVSFIDLSCFSIF